MCVHLFVGNQEAHGPTGHVSERPGKGQQLCQELRVKRELLLADQLWLEMSQWSQGGMGNRIIWWRESAIMTTDLSAWPSEMNAKGHCENFYMHT